MADTISSAASAISIQGNYSSKLEVIKGSANSRFVSWSGATEGYPLLGIKIIMLHAKQPAMQPMDKTHGGSNGWAVAVSVKVITI